MERVGGVIICGAGPVGLLTALGLARQGIKVTVLEAESSVSHSPRANGYFPPTIELLDAFGLYEDVAAIAYQSQTVQFHFKLIDQVVEMSMAALEGSVKFPFFLHFGQHVLGETALKHLARFPHAEVRWNSAVESLRQDAAGVTVGVATPSGKVELQADWLIGTDGARSTVRRLAGLAFDGFTWPDRYVATNMRFDFAKYGFAPNNMLHHPEHWAIVTRLGRDDLWRVTYGEDPALPEDEILRRIPEHYAHILPSAEPYEVVAAAPYRVHERACTSFRAGRVLMAGDAAHACNPIGGMGLTSGAFDALSLTQALGAVINGTAPDSLLDTYAAERRRVFLEVASPTAQEHKGRVQEADPARQAEAAAGFRAVSQNRDMMREGMAMSFRIRSAPMV